MSLAEVAARPVAVPAVHPHGAFVRLYRSELKLVFGRRRNQVLLAALALVPLLIGIAVRVTADNGSGPPFLNRVSSNGLFLVFTALAVCLPLFLPLAVGIISGDAVAGEAGTGTLRYLLAVPVTRGRLLAVKALGSATYALAAVFVIALVGLVAGAALFGLGDVTLLSGDAVPLANGLLRALGVATYVVLSLSGLVAVGLFFSTVTEVPVAAMATTVAFAVVTAVLNSLPQLSAIHPLLLTHHWLDFGELLRGGVDLASLASGLWTQVAYVAIFCSLAWARFTTADITA